MGWVPATGWLTKIALDGRAGAFTYDLAIDPTGTAKPSLVAAGLVDPARPGEPVDGARAALTVLVLVAGLALVGGTVAARRSPLDRS
jgi:hypothetical protein